MYKFLLLAPLFALLVDCASCGRVRQTAFDALTIILPKQGETARSSLRCTLEIAANSSTVEDFNYSMDIQKFQKSRDGMEYIPNYYTPGNNNSTDSCTFRVYPKILDKLSFKIGVNKQSDNKHWRIVVTHRIIDPGSVFKQGVLLKRIFIFFMNEWSWWEAQHANAVKLQERMLSNWATTEYFYIQ